MSGGASAAAAKARARISREEALLSDLRAGRPLGRAAAASLVWRLSFPTVIAELSTIAMEYIDAAMVGRLGAGGAAAIGLVAATTWLFWGMIRACSTGFSVQVAQEIGASRFASARSVMLQGVVAATGSAAVLGIVAAAISAPLPRWLGGDQALWRDASRYFLVSMVAFPVMQFPYLGARMLQAAGDMKTAGVLNVLMCALDVVFNFLFIFPSRHVSILGAKLFVPGFGMGVTGAAAGSVAAGAVAAALVAWTMFARNRHLALRRGDALRFSRDVLRKAVRIGAPVAFESAVMTGAMVVSTAIVAPLGTVALAANSLAITAESLCYMPGYGISSAATTLVGQAVGAARGAMARRFAWLCTWSGVGVMTFTGALLFAFAPGVMGLLVPDAAVIAAGAEVLRIEAFAEPFFAASIVAGGALRGAGDSLVPSVMNFASMWAVRIPLAALLAPVLGLRGAWIAMAVELVVRGALLSSRLAAPRRWLLPALRSGGALHSSPSE